MKIFIIGFMGSGKTTMGHELSQVSNLNFYNMDTILEANFNKTINELFRSKGEKWFRKQESKLLLNWNEEGIISTGGGIIELPENRFYLKKSEHIVIWLDLPWDILTERILNGISFSSGRRPLVEKLGEKGLRELYLKREPLYRETASIRLTDNKIDASLIELLKNR